MADRPILEPTYATVYAWLSMNGVDEWLPEVTVIEVDERSGTIRYLAFAWQTDAERGFNPYFLVNDDGVVFTWRTVPLRIPPPPEVMDAALLGGCALVAGTSDGRGRDGRSVG